MKSAFVQRHTAPNTPASLMGRARFDSFWKSPWISTTVSTQLEFHFGEKRAGHRSLTALYCVIYSDAPQNQGDVFKFMAFPSTPPLSFRWGHFYI